MRACGLATALLCLAATPASADSHAALEQCLEERLLPRVARVLGPDGVASYVRVLAQADGIPTRVAPIAVPGGDIAALFDRAAAADGSLAWEIPPEEAAVRICSPVALPQSEIDAETRVVVAAGLNYAAHAEEAGGGDVFVFPKPVEPTPPYGSVAPPAGVTLLDYEVELGFLLLEDVDLGALPTREELLARAAFFVSNDVTDREPIIMNATLSGAGTGFVEAKGQPNFMPVGPWMVRGTELFAALEACGRAGLGIRLAVDEGEGFQPRQQATTDLMILDPLAFLGRIAEEIDSEGLRTAMTVDRDGRIRRYPFAVDSDAPRLPAGSVILTGTPDGVALQAPSPVGVTARALLRFRTPFEQFRREEIERATSGAPGGYLAPGDRMRASIDGLGAQVLRIEAAGSPPQPDPCAGR